MMTKIEFDAFVPYGSYMVDEGWNKSVIYCNVALNAEDALKLLRKHVYMTEISKKRNIRISHINSLKVGIWTSLYDKEFNGIYGKEVW